MKNISTTLTLPKDEYGYNWSGYESSFIFNDDNTEHPLLGLLYNHGQWYCFDDHKQYAIEKCSHVLWDAYVEDIVSTVCKLKTEGSLPEKDKHAPECPPKVDVPSCETCAYCYEQTTDNGARNFVCGRIENGEPAEYMYLDGEATVLRGQAYMALSSTDNDQRAHTCCGYYKQETRTETY